MGRSISSRRLRLQRKARPVLAECLETRCLFAADLVISEFLASNDHSITTNAGTREDWIEIHNRGDAPAHLNDYFLTDSAGDPEQWRFPAQDLAAGGYLIVFASGLNVAVAGQELHTNFKLSASGEYLGLIRAADDSVVFEYAPAFPQQTTDISYGLSNADDAGSARTYFSTPTPGAANNASVQAVAFSQAGRTFAGSVQFTLSTVTPGASIYYTLNGATPTQSSTPYTPGGFITLTSTAVVRARAFAAAPGGGGTVASPVTSETFVAIDTTSSGANTTAIGSATVAGFSSNLPIVIIDTFGTPISDTVANAASATFIDTTDANGRADMLDVPNFNGRIGFRIRGSTSQNYPKKQYAVELWDENNDDKKVSLLGMPAESDWILYAPYTEKSLMQNALAMQWANETGQYASRTRYVEVYLNTGTSKVTASDYLGVYILMEKIKDGDDRVDITKMSTADNAGDAVTGGYMFKKDRVEATEKSFTTSLQAQKFAMVEPDENSITAQQLSYITGYMNDFEAALFGANFADPVNGYAKYIDVDSFVDYYLVNEMTRNIDAFWLSTFYSKDRNGKVKAGPVWDFNLSLGAANYNFSANSAGWDTDTLTMSQDPYYKRLLQDPNFVQRVSDRWAELRSTVFSTPRLMADIDAKVALLSDGNGNYPVGTNPTQAANNPVVRNFKRWPELGTYVTTEGLYDPAGNWIQEVNLMKNWLAARVNWIDSQFVPKPLTTPGGDFGGPVTVSMTPRGGATTTDTVIIGENQTFSYIAPTVAIPGWNTVGFNASSWATGKAGFGYDTARTGSGAVDFIPYVTTNVQSLLSGAGKPTSFYVRTTFTLNDPSAIEALILKVRYDDGFVAWINGVRVMDANSPENINPSNTTASASSTSDSLAITYREFDITSVKNLLVAGNNVLAIQGLNSGNGSNDFLLAPTLYSRTYANPTAGTVYYTTDGSDPRTAGGGVSPTALVYASPFAVTTSTRIKARTLVNGVWGALSDETYNFDSTALRITELMYNPPAPPAGSPFTAQDFEYIEVRNTSASPLSLAGYTVSNGIVFAFPDTTLAAGAYGVIVKNVAAFQSRYGTSANILGAFASGSLDNGGETVALSDGLGNVIQSFKYEDGWYPATDGGGPSLVIVDPAESDAVAGTAAGWRASYVTLGAPGYPDADATAPHVTGAYVNDVAGQPTVHFTFDTVMAAGSAGGLTVTAAPGGTPVAVTSSLFDGKTATFSLPASLASGIYTITLPAGQAVNVGGVGIVAAFTFSVALVRAGQTLQLASLGSTEWVVQQLAIGAGGRLDIGAGAIALDYTGASPEAAVRSMLFAGRNGGAWNGAGIVSSTAPIAIGYAEAFSVGVTTLAGQALDDSTLLIKYAALGDATLDGRVNADDLILTDRGAAKGLTNWIAGDYDYDGVVTQADYDLLYPAYIMGPMAPGGGPREPLPVVTMLSVEPPAAPAEVVKLKKRVAPAKKAQKAPVRQKPSHQYLMRPIFSRVFIRGI